MKKILLIFLMIILMFGCSDNNNEKTNLHILNFGEYIEKDLIHKFENEYDVNIIYETSESNESIYTKLKSNNNYDIVIATDYIVERLIEENYLQKIDCNKITNYNNLDTTILNHDYDPNNTYTVPYFWGTVGILYNQKNVDKDDVTGWELLKNKKYKNQIYMYDSQRESFLPALKSLGYSVNTENELELKEAYEWLVEQINLVNPIYVGDEIIDRMISGEKDIAIIYSGDAAYVMSENKDMKYYEPKEGTNVWIDSMTIPKSAKEIDLAHTFINFMLDIDNAIANTKAVGYTSPITKAIDEMINGEFKNISAYTPRFNNEKDEVFRNPSNEIRGLIAELFVKVKAH